MKNFHTCWLGNEFDHSADGHCRAGRQLEGMGRAGLHQRDKLRSGGEILRGRRRRLGLLRGG